MVDRAKLDFYDVTLRPDATRTVVRPFEPSYGKGFDGAASRTQEVIDHILGLDQDEMMRQLSGVTESLDVHHRDVDRSLQRRFDEMAHTFSCPPGLAPEKQRLIGAYFTQEYAYEAAALFNPSAVLHPDQSDAPPGGVRIVLSLRGIGEGHVSSVTFRTGSWTPSASGRGTLEIDRPGGTSVPPIIEQGGSDDDLEIHLHCGGSRSISETVLFPITPAQRQGIEDMRLVRFVEDDGSVIYYGTYTAYSGSEARSELISGSDFASFEMRVLTGDASGGKGMALFPRRIDGRYAMLGRQDGKNIFLLYSDDILHWDGGTRLISPQYPWEFVQVGNCGSPLELDEGWLVMTHGVGTVRNYCMGATLLDKGDPSKVLARTPRPILAPDDRERDGYVPNVVYSCGSLLKDRTLLLPYGVADSLTGFASIRVDNLLGCME